MARLIILEGARTAGKSTAARKLRSTLKSSTLINMTGYPEDGEEGKRKIVNYYDAFMTYINMLDNSHTIILDRTFFSEMIFSKLYKNYDFTREYYNYLEEMVVFKHRVHIFKFKVDRSMIRKRLSRSKTDHFSTTDTVLDIMEQQVMYKRMFNDLQENGFFDQEFRTYAEIDTTFMESGDSVKNVMHYLDNYDSLHL